MSLKSALQHEYPDYAQADFLAQQQADFARAQQVPIEAQQAERALEVDRRTVVRTGLAVATTAAIQQGLPGMGLKELAEWTGEQLDSMEDLEKIMPNPIIALEVREDDTPTVEAKQHGKSITINPSFSEGGVLRFAPDLQAEAEHVPYQDLELGKGTFNMAGVGIITTAEGLVDGKQEFIEMFEDNTTGQLVGVGYEGGLYVYKRELGKAEGTSGEWVRIVTRPDKNGPLSALINGKTYEEMRSFMPEQKLIHRVKQGTDTLRRIGYQAYGAILPTTKMPEMKTITVGSINNTASEIMFGRGLFVTEQGDLIDIDHLQGKASETLQLFADLLAKNPNVGVGYALGSSATYKFAIEPSVLTSENTADLTASIMNTVTMLMEGISQRDMFETMPKAVNDLLPAFGHYNPEDAFTNTLATTEMLTVIKEMGVAETLKGKIEAIKHRHGDKLTAEQMHTKINEMVREMAPQLVRMVMSKVVHERGVRAIKQPLTLELPLGIYHNIPVKISTADAANTSRINKKAAGLNPKNMQAHEYQTTNLPVLEVVAGKAISKITH